MNIYIYLMLDAGKHCDTKTYKVPVLPTLIGQVIDDWLVEALSPVTEKKISALRRKDPPVSSTTFSSGTKSRAWPGPFRHHGRGRRR